MTLDELNAAERGLVSRIRNISGLIEEKIVRLEENGIFEDYRKVYEAYADLIEPNAEGLEALKRSIFLLWFEEAEPPFLSGLDRLSENVSRKIFSDLEHYAESKNLDFEMEWMLPHYYAIAEWVFDVKNKCSPILRTLLTDNHKLWRKELKSENFIDRGRMGTYWASLSQSKAVFT